MQKYIRYKYRHIYGIGNQFIKPQGRNQWYPINEDRWEESTPRESFFFSNEALYLLENSGIKLRVQMKLDAGQTEERMQKALREEALREIARDLKASMDEEKLAEAIDFFSRHDELFDT